MNDPLDEMYQVGWSPEDADAAWEQFLAENPSLGQIYILHIPRELRWIVWESYHAGLRAASSMIASMAENSQKKVRP